MATGREKQLARQIGEHLVAAKLGRLGYVATPFAGNVPMFDLLAADAQGYAIPIQVKAINGPSWQLKADHFLKIEVIDDEQVVKGKANLPNPSLICIFVRITHDERDVFYVMQLQDLQELIFTNYKGGRRPRNPRSFHYAIWPRDIEAFRDNWQLIGKQFLGLLNHRLGN